MMDLVIIQSPVQCDMKIKQMGIYHSQMPDRQTTEQTIEVHRINKLSN